MSRKGGKEGVSGGREKESFGLVVGSWLLVGRGRIRYFRDDLIGC